MELKIGKLKKLLQRSATDRVKIDAKQRVTNGYWLVTLAPFDKDLPSDPINIGTPKYPCQFNVKDPKANNGKYDTRDFDDVIPNESLRQEVKPEMDGNWLKTLDGDHVVLYLFTVGDGDNKEVCTVNKQYVDDCLAVAGLTIRSDEVKFEVEQHYCLGPLVMTGPDGFFAMVMPRRT